MPSPFFLFFKRFLSKTNKDNRPPTSTSLSISISTSLPSIYSGQAAQALRQAQYKQASFFQEATIDVAFCYL